MSRLTSKYALRDSVGGVFRQYDQIRPDHFGHGPSEACHFSSVLFWSFWELSLPTVSKRSRGRKRNSKPTIGSAISAELARSQPRDTPIGAGDLLHIDVFDVPELSRDVRVSDAGDISYPVDPE